MIRNILFFLLTISILISASCKKKQDVNPFDDPELQPPSNNSGLGDIDPSNFAYLHKQVFKPTCANSGCHDGTFVPDFRTIYSSYNTLIYQRTSNGTISAVDSFRYRVKPFYADSSMLYHRLNRYFDGTQGIMPLQTEPSSDWPARKTEYIQAIKTWINTGAKDMFGNYPTSGNKQPQIIGFVACPQNQTNEYSRLSGTIAPIGVPQGMVDLWFALVDDSTSSNAIVCDSLSISTSFINYTVYDQNLGNVSVVSSPLLKADFSGNANTSFYHKKTINTSSFPVGTYLYLRVYCKDGTQSIAEIPNAGSEDKVQGLFCLKIQ